MKEDVKCFFLVFLMGRDIKSDLIKSFQPAFLWLISWIHFVRLNWFVYDPSVEIFITWFRRFVSFCCCYFVGGGGNGQTINNWLCVWRCSKCQWHIQIRFLVHTQLPNLTLKWYATGAFFGIIDIMYTLL